MHGRCFLSYARKDIAFVRETLIPIIESVGLRIWLDEERLVAGTEFGPEIRNALLISDWVVVVLSPAAVRSRWVRAETALAMGRLADRLIPVVAAACDPTALSPLLAGLQVVSFPEAGELQAALSLIRRFGGGEFIARADAVLGLWIGTIVQEPDTQPGSIPIPAMVELQRHERSGIRGILTAEFPDETYRIAVEGELRYAKYLFLNYRGLGQGFIQFGSILLVLSDAADTLAGRFLGYGPRSNQIIGGTTSLARDYQQEKIATWEREESLDVLA